MPKRRTASAISRRGFTCCMEKMEQAMQATHITITATKKNSVASDFHSTTRSVAEAVMKMKYCMLSPWPV